MRLPVSLWAFMLLWSSQAVGQSSWELSDSLQVGTVTAFSENFRGDVYLGLQTGDVMRFRADGAQDLVYNTYPPASVSAINALTGLQTMVYYEDLQQFLLLDRFLQPVGERITLNQADGYISALCPAADGLYWQVNQSRYSLQKVDLQLNKLVQERFLWSVAEDTLDLSNALIQEYSGRLFLAPAAGGIYQFDLTGSYLGKTETPGPLIAMGTRQAVTKVFSGFYQQDLFAQEAARILLPPTAKGARGVWLTQKALFVWKDNWLLRYRKKG